MMGVGEILLADRMAVTILGFYTVTVDGGELEIKEQETKEIRNDWEYDYMEDPEGEGA